MASQSAPRGREHPASSAARHGRDLLAAGDRSGAVAWLDRASRLAPDDHFVRLSLATALAGFDDARALALFQALVAEGGSREAHLGLAVLHLRRGDDAAAGGILADLLQRFAPPRGARFAETATTIAARAGAAGWVGCDAAGRLTLQLGAPRSGPPGLRLDARPLRLCLAEVGPVGTWTAQLPPDASQGLAASTAEGVSLLGSPLPLGLLRRSEGIVEAFEGGLRGWIRHPADPDVAPTVAVMPAGRPGNRQVLVTPTGLDGGTEPEAMADSPRWGFALPRGQLPGTGCLRVTGPDGRDLLGSPLDPMREERLAARAASRLGRARGRARPGPAAADPDRPLPALAAVPPRRSRRAARATGVTIVIPVYRGAAEFRACLRSVLEELPEQARVVVVDDNSPDPALLEELRAAERRRLVEVVRHPINRGFPAAANSGLRRAGDDDVVLLNSDTMVPPGWLDRLRRVAHARPDIGSVTPFTNDGSIASYPNPAGGAAPADAAALAALDAALHAANGEASVELPTGVGFCMYVRNDCLAEVGLLREDVFAQGYGEENDWCLRARRLGWRHVLATGLFVAHLGGRSFGAAKAHLMRRNAAVLEGLHPGYAALIQAFHDEDPLRAARRRADAERWRAARQPAGAVLMVTHDRGGGVERHLAARSASLRAAGLRPVILRPAAPGEPAGCRLSDGLPEDAYPGLRFVLPGELDALLALLRQDQVRRVELHHLLGHAPEVTQLAGLLGAAQHVVVHDHAWICPRISLLGREGRYCGEPAPSACADCVEDLGAAMAEPEVGGLRAASARLLGAAALVTAPTQDVAARLVRHLGPLPGLRVAPWEAGRPLTPRPPARHADGTERRIAILGAIGPEKGYDVLLDCARDAARRDLPLRFVVVGRTADDARLLRTGRVFVTGSFAEGEAASLLRQHDPVAGFVPSVIPETWCYALSDLLDAGLPVAAFDLGGQAERLRTVPGSLLLRRDGSPSATNDRLLAWIGAATPLP